MPCSAVMQTATCPMGVHALRAREGLLVRREPKSMAERKGVRECVEALNIKRRELEKERERLCQVHHQRHTHCCGVRS